MRHPNKRQRGFKKPKTESKQFFYKEDIFLSRMASVFKIPQQKVKVLFSERTVSTIRLNGLAADTTEIYNLLKKKGLELKPIEWSKDTYIVTNKDKSELGKMPEYDKGLFYIQNLGSMLPAVILDLKETDKVLDMCAAPGSKTTQMADLMHNKGEIIANDDDYDRIYKMSSVLKQFYVTNTSVHYMNADKLGDQYPDFFDKVLLDAPCSGEGMVYLARPKPLRFWSIKKTKTMAKIQSRLIKAAFKALKPGGLMIYSTCTVSPTENESIVTELLNTEKRAQLQDITLIQSKEFEPNKPFIRHALASWNGEEFHPDIKKAIRVVPGKTMMGFFVALIKKV